MLLICLLSLINVVLAVNYTTVLNAFTEEAIDYSSKSKGLVIWDDRYGLKNRDKSISWLGNFETVNYISFDNSNMVGDLSEMANAALHDKLYGDFVYIYALITANGQVSTYPIAGNNNFGRYLQDYGLSENDIVLLSSTTSSDKLSNYYKNYKFDNTKHPTNHNYNHCNSNSAPSKSDCSILADFVGTGPTCIGNCCVSWSGKFELDTGFIRDRIKWSEGGCVNNDKSCKIFHMRAYSKVFNFCIGRSFGCKGGEEKPYHDEL